MKFRATIELAGKTATGIEVPGAVVAKLGSSQKPVSGESRRRSALCARAEASPETLPARRHYQLAIGKRLHSSAGNNDLEVADGWGRSLEETGTDSVLRRGVLAAAFQPGLEVV